MNPKPFIFIASLILGLALLWLLPQVPYFTLVLGMAWFGGALLSPGWQGLVGLTLVAKMGVPSLRVV